MKARRHMRGPSSSVHDAWRINFSFVLHESAGSETVRTYVERASLHAGSLAMPSNQRRMDDQSIGMRELEELAPQMILSATIGLPAILSRVAAGISTQPAVIFADAASANRQDATFFRAPARPRLPEYEVSRLAVAAAVLRPGGKSVDIVSRGPFNWPDERDAALGALEDLIRSHVAQWMPPVALWDAAADALLPDDEIEIAPTEPGAAGRRRR